MTGLEQGTVFWAWLDPAVGREQAGRRPVVVVSSDGYADVVTSLLVVVPVSRVDRGWPDQVPLSGLPGLAGFAITDFAEAPHHDSPTSRFMPGYFATRAVRRG